MNTKSLTKMTKSCLRKELEQLNQNSGFKFGFSTRIFDNYEIKHQNFLSIKVHYLRLCVHSLFIFCFCFFFFKEKSIESKTRK